MFDTTLTRLETRPPDPRAASLVDLAHTASALRRVSDDLDASAEEIASALRAADDCMAIAATLLSRAQSTGRIERTTGLPTEHWLRMDGRRVSSEPKAIAQLAATCARMPAFGHLVRTGVISHSQALALSSILRPVLSTHVERVDRFVHDCAHELTDAEPDQLIWDVQALIDDLYPGPSQARENRLIDAERLTLCPSLDGGGSLYAQAGPDSFAILAEAIEDAAVSIASPDDDDGPDSRARQRFDGLLGIAESWLADGTGRGRPAPRVLLTAQLEDLQHMGAERAVRQLSQVTGRPVTLSPIASRAALCDAECQTVLFAGSTPIAVSDATRALPDKVRTAVIARDGGCMGPGCRMPAAWTEVHHIHGRGPDASHDPNDLVLLCRRCHRRVHRRGWKLRRRDDGAIEHTFRRRTYVTYPRARRAIVHALE